MTEKKITDRLIIRFLSDVSTPEENNKILSWLNESHENRLYYFRFKRLWQNSSVNKGLNSDFVDEAWDRMSIRMEKEKQGVKSFTDRISFFRRIAVAASIILLAGIAGFFYYQNRQYTGYLSGKNEIEVPYGSRSMVKLPDGTRVWLNAGTKIQYNFVADKHSRDVYLEGEAFFDVTHIPNTVFTVRTTDLSIQVLGTRFNVKSYPDEKTIETTLERGKIVVDAKGAGNKMTSITLEPNQKLTYTREGGKFTLNQTGNIKNNKDGKQDGLTSDTPHFKIAKNIKPEVYSSWKDGVLIFQGESLENLARKLERRYDVTIHLENDSVKKYTYTGTLEDLTLEQVLRAIRKTSKIEYKIKDKDVYLTLNNKPKR